MMAWVPTVDYVEAVPLKRRGTKKKIWDDLTQSWQDVTIWTVDNSRQLRDWLDENYPNQSGWKTAWTDTKIVMEERVYIHYALKFEL
jgi:hypothetical protein